MYNANHGSSSRVIWRLASNMPLCTSKKDLKEGEHFAADGDGYDADRAEGQNFNTVMLHHGQPLDSDNRARAPPIFCRVALLGSTQGLRARLQRLAAQAASAARRLLNVSGLHPRASGCVRPTASTGRSFWLCIC